VIVTNQTSYDYWFGPLHLPGGLGQQITVDDTSETSLYLLDDNVADAINNLAASGRVTVTSAAPIFPRATGTPTVLHGDGSPEGMVYAPQGSLYMRRDGSQYNAGILYLKASGVASSTGWLDLATAVGNVAAPTGTVVSFGGASAPEGWLICDGSAVSRTLYATLYGVIQDTYGNGDGSTTFNLPDLRGRVAVGWAASGGHPDVSTRGNSEEIAVAYRRPKHRHSPHFHSTHAIALYSTGSGSGFASGGDGPPNNYPTDSTDGGSGNSNDSLDAPAWLVLNHIIKT
jgi:microcystin-dependent protein